MKTGTPVSNPGARRYFQRPGPRAPEAEATRSWRPPADQSDRTQRKDW